MEKTNKPKTIKKMVIGTYILIITLNVNTKPIYMLSTRDLLRPRDTYRLKVRRWKKIFHAKGNQKKAGVAILISDKI